MLMLSHNHGIGETLMAATIFHGLEISISLLIVDLAGLTDLPAQLLTESILLETNHGQI